MQGRYLEKLSWPEAEVALRESAIVVLPIGAGSKEHGLHLPLNTDRLLAQYFVDRVLQDVPALALPTLTYGYYPAFRAYPGSIHIQRDTFTATVVDIAQSVARHGARRFYVLNTGISTNWGLEPARQKLAAESIVMEYTDLRALIEEVADDVRQQAAGTHADEIETSMLLYIQPEVVRMELAQRDISSTDQPGPLTRDPHAEQGLYSPTGAWGDPTLATRAKGHRVVERIVAWLVAFLEHFGQEDYQPAPRRDEYL
jgi:creatinine amidohydrolase